MPMRRRNDVGVCECNRLTDVCEVAVWRVRLAAWTNSTSGGYLDKQHQCGLLGLVESVGKEHRVRVCCCKAVADECRYLP